MRLLIADDHRIVRDGLRWMLSGEPEIEIVGEAADGAELLDALAEKNPDVVLLDVRMPGMGGLETLEQMAGSAPDVRVIMLSMYDDITHVRRAIELGAFGYLLKNTSRDELIRALTLVAAGKPYVQGELTAPLVHELAVPTAEDLFNLESRERNVLQLIARGQDNRRIASDLGVTEATVRSSLRTIFNVLHVRTRSEAVAAAIRHGIIE